MRWMVVFSLMFAGCTSEAVMLGRLSTEPTDAGVPDTRADATVDVAIDTAPDADDTALDAPIDASIVSATIAPEFLFQSCMLPTPTDPVRVKATIALDNPSSVSFGTLRATKGSIVSGTFTVATFEFPEVALTLSPMSSVRQTFEKTNDSVEPKASCGTLTCGGTVRIEVLLTGPVAPITARSGDITVDCAY